MTFPYDSMIPDSEEAIRPGIPIMVYSTNQDNQPDGILDIRYGQYYLITRDGIRYNIPLKAIITKHG